MKRATKIAVILIGLFVFSMRPVYALSFADTEASEENNATAGSIDLTLLDDSDNALDEELFDGGELTDDDDAEGSLQVISDGSLDFEYTFYLENESGDTQLCDAFSVVVDIDGSEEFDGAFSALENTSFEVSSDEDDVDLEIYLNDLDPDLQGLSCEFDIEVQGWQVGGSPDSGFYDIEEITGNELISGYWAPPEVEVIVPNGGEVYEDGDIAEIEWTAEPWDPSATIVDIDIYLSKDGGATYPDTIVEDITGSTYSWTIDKDSFTFGPGEAPDTLKIKVIAEDSNGFVGEDESDANFDPVFDEDEDEDEDSDENEDKDTDEGDSGEGEPEPEAESPTPEEEQPPAKEEDEEPAETDEEEEEEESEGAAGEEESSKEEGNEESTE